MGLVDANIFNRKDRIQKVLQPSGFDRGIEHLGRPLENRGAHAGGLQFTERVGDLGKRIEREVKRHQTIAKIAFEVHRFQGKVESVSRYLPEIRMASLGGPEPRILQLLVAPEGRQFIDIVPQPVATLSGRCRKIKSVP